MAGVMIVLGRRIIAVRSGSWGGISISPAFSLGQRNLCSSGGDGRYVQHPNTFVAGNPEGGEPWPPPTQGGFVAETYPGQDHQQSPEPYVPVTQGGFVAGNVDYSSYQAQAPPPPPPPGYAPGYSYPYVQYPHAAQPPPPPPPPYPQQYPGENPWAPYHQPGYTYGQEPGYAYPQQYAPAPPPSYVSPSSYQQVPQAQANPEGFQGWTPAPPFEPPVEAQTLEQVEAPERVEPEVEVVTTSVEVEQVSHGIEEVEASTPAETEVSEPVSGEPHGDETIEKAEVLSAGDGEKDGAASESELDDDPTAAAMAEIGVSSSRDAQENEQSEDGGEKAEVIVESHEEEDEPAKGSLLDVETSKAKPAPPPQSESFLDILSKTNLNRQTRPRPPQLTLRSNRKTYARLHNLPRQILKGDLVNYFSEINLQKENIHIAYDEKFYPLYAQIGFDSTEALRDAHKILQTKGRFGGRIVRWEQFIQFSPPGHSQISESMRNYLGRMLVMLHLPPEGRLEDVERFFDSYGYDPSALSMIEPIGMTLARFPKEGSRSVRRAAIGFFSSLEAMRALRERQGDFILNEPVELRLIQ